MAHAAIDPLLIGWTESIYWANQDGVLLGVGGSFDAHQTFVKIEIIQRKENSFHSTTRLAEMSLIKEISYIGGIEEKIEQSTSIRDQVFSEAYDCVVKLSCPLLPRDCQIEIINLLSPIPLSQSFILKQSRARVQEKGFIVKLLPEAKILNYRPYSGEVSIEKELHELRRSFSMTFQITNLEDLNIDQDCLFYFIRAFGSKEDYEKIANPKNDSRERTCKAIYLALKYRNVKLIQYFQKIIITSRNDFTKDMCSIVLGFSAEFGYLKMVQSLVEDFQSDPSAEDNHAVKHAAVNGHLAVVKYLMEEADPKYGVNPASGNDNIAIRGAALNGHLDVVKYLIEEVDEKYGVDPAHLGNVTIGNAASNGHLDVIKYLMNLDSKYHVDAAEDDNWTIILAASCGQLAVVKYLIEDVDEEYGIDPAAQDNEAVKLAVEEGYLAVVKYLMNLDSKYGIDQSLCRQALCRH